MTHDILAWAAVILLAPAAYPLARTWLARSPQADGPVLTWTLALGLASGMLTLIMFWMSVLGLRYSVISIAVLYLTGIGLGIWLLSRLSLAARAPACDVGSSLPGSPSPELPPRRTKQRAGKPRHTPALWALLLISIVAGAVLFNAVYWPFTRDDVVALYHPFAQQMARQGVLIPLTGADSLHRMYPMNIPLGFTFAYLAAGWDNEYLARLMPALLSLGCLPAGFILGRRLGGESTGWLAAFLLAITPLFGNWASTGYTELPMGLYLTLGAIFALRLWLGGNWADAMLAGLCIGLATWTKNNALIFIVPLVVWFAWTLIHRQASWRALVGGFIACAVVGAPWYLRNIFEVSAVLPNTAWTDQARRTLESLAIFITLPDNFGVAGWAMFVGVGWAFWECRRPVAASKRLLPVLIWIIPFFAAWWLYASYDPRFLASLLPLLAVLAATACSAGWSRLPEEARRIASPTLAVVAIALTLYSAFFIVEYKDELLRNPLMDSETKLAVVEARRHQR